MSRRDGAIFLLAGEGDEEGGDDGGVVHESREQRADAGEAEKRRAFRRRTRILPERRCNSGERSITVETSNSTTSVASAGLVKLARNASVLMTPPSMKATATLKKATAGRRGRWQARAAAAAG